MAVHGPVNWVQHFPIPFSKLYADGVISIPPGKLEHVNSGILVTILIALFSILAARRIRGREAEFIIPPKRATLPGLADFIMESLYGMVQGTLGPKTKDYFPFVGALFLFILVSNLFGMIPYAGAPTSSLSTTLALGLATFVFYNAVGIRKMGLKSYLAHFLMGLGPAGIFIALLEVISHLLRPVTLGVRLGMNIMLDHQILHTFENLVAWFVPVPLLLFGLVVCIIQAFVFATLTAVYIELATETHEHEEAHGH